MNYWQTRELQQRVRLYNLTQAQIEELLRKEYLKVYKEVFLELRELYLTLPKNPSANDLYKNDRFYKLINMLQEKLIALGQKEKTLLTNNFVDFYKTSISGYESDMMYKVTDEKALEAINAVWTTDGKNFSDRIWNNKAALLEKLKTGLVTTITTGKNWATLSKDIKNTFGTGYSQSQRLVRTELTHIQTKSTIDKYTAEGVTQVRFIAEPDCCEHCKANNNKIFDINNAPQPPVHVNCRCALIAIVN